MTAEEIVRRLAAAGLPLGGLGLCAYCRVLLPERGPDLPGSHRPDCLWRLAVEWVAADDARLRATKHCSSCGHIAGWHLGPAYQGCRGPECKCVMFYGEDCDCGDYPNHPPGHPKPEREP